MTTGRMGSVLRHLDRAALRGDGEGWTDGQLLECFLTRREEAAFAALVRRHGPMVLGVCRRVLRDERDAEDAFQATFLVLFRKAASLVRKDLVGNWLYGVAYRTALEARSAAARRRAREGPAHGLPEPVAPPVPAGEDWRPLLDAELHRLPEKYRAAVVLCELEGRPRREVAGRLGIPEGTLSSRLAAARKMLADRLARRGVALPTAALAGTAAGAPNAGATMPAALVSVTVKAAGGAAAGQSAAAGAVPASVAALTEGVMRTMHWARLRVTFLWLLAVGVAGGGAAWLVAAAPGERNGAANRNADEKPAAGEKKAPARQPAEKGKTDPPGVPLQLTVKVNQETYKLDLGGQSADEFRKTVETISRTMMLLPKASAVDLALEIKNTSDKDVRIWTSGDLAEVGLDLKGPSALDVKYGGAFDSALRLGPAVTVGAGQTQTIPLKTLAHGFRGMGSHAYWLQPGEYTLTVRFQTGMSPRPEGSQETEMGFGKVTLTAPPVKLKVEK